MNRSKWKGPYFKSKKVKNNNKVQTLQRSFEIIPQLVGSTIQLHNGRKFAKLLLTEEMIGHKIGEFSPTREKFEFKKKKKKKVNGTKNKS